MFTGHYDKLRKNASLRAVAEEAHRNYKRAVNQWRDHRDAVRDNPDRNSWESLEREERLFRYLDECKQISDHLRRLAGIDES